MVVKTAVLKELETQLDPLEDIYELIGKVMRFIWQAVSGKRIVIEDFPAEQKSLLLSCTVCVTGVSKTDDGGSVRGKTAGQAAKI